VPNARPESDVPTGAGVESGSLTARGSGSAPEPRRSGAHQAALMTVTMILKLSKRALCCDLDDLALLLAHDRLAEPVTRSRACSRPVRPRPNSTMCGTRRSCWPAVRVAKREPTELASFRSPSS